MRGRAPQDREARLRQLRRALEVEEAQCLAEFFVRLGGEGERARRSPAAHLDVLRLGRAGGHRRIGEVRDLEEDSFELRVDRLELRVEEFDAVAHLTHPHRLSGRVLAASFRQADRLGGSVAEGLELLALLDETAAGGVKVEDALHQLGATPVGKPALNRFGLLADQPEVQHGRYCASTDACSASTRATEPARSSASSSMMRTPQVLRP